MLHIQALVENSVVFQTLHRFLSEVPCFDKAHYQPFQTDPGQCARVCIVRKEPALFILSIQILYNQWGPLRQFEHRFDSMQLCRYMLLWERNGSSNVGTICNGDLHILYRLGKAWIQGFVFMFSFGVMRSSSPANDGIFVKVLFLGREHSISKNVQVF